MTLLSTIEAPSHLRSLSDEQLALLAAEIRAFLVDSVARTGGHLGPNLGAVELTIALHRVFDSPKDTILFDTGHQAYVHKMLTGRQAGFATLRQEGGLSGYPSQAESEHDVIENSHASTALSYADGLSRAYRMRGETDRAVVAVVGDGALTGGMAWEALNNLTTDGDRPVVIVVNDNGRSYSPTIGGLASHLSALRLTHGYERVMDFINETVPRAPIVGPAIHDTLQGIKKGVKDIVAPQGMFEDLGIKYLGPIDGHDEPAVERALRLARDYGHPVIVHCITVKGCGYPPAENDDEDRLHSRGAFDPTTGKQRSESGRSWTKVFSDELLALAAERPDVVAVTAAMLHPTGLAATAHAFPGRVYDVGIAEQHAVTSAAGLAIGGFHPVVAVYSTFLNRAFDQVLMDVALHKLPVTFVLDRAGVTGDDGASHNGMWDMSILQVVPSLRIAAPRDGARLRELLREAVAVTDGPTVVRFPKGVVVDDVAAIDAMAEIDVLARYGDEDLLLVGIGPMAGVCVEAARLLRAHGIGVTVVDPRWVKPLTPSLVPLARRHRRVAVVEDNGRVGGVGDAFARLLRDHATDVPVRSYGIPQRFLAHAKRSRILAQIGLTPQGVARDLVEWTAKRADGPAGGRRHEESPVAIHPGRCSPYPASQEPLTDVGRKSG